MIPPKPIACTRPRDPNSVDYGPNGFRTTRLFKIVDGVEVAIWTEESGEPYPYRPTILSWGNNGVAELMSSESNTWKNEYNGLTLQLDCDVTVCQFLDGMTIDHLFVESKAVWDTGCTTSSISKNLIRKLGLTPTGEKSLRIDMHGNAEYVDTYDIIVQIGTGPTIKIDKAREMSLPDFGILLGMDVITLGDFTVSSSSGKTVATYECTNICSDSK